MCLNDLEIYVMSDCVSNHHFNLVCQRIICSDLTTLGQYIETQSNIGEQIVTPRDDWTNQGFCGFNAA